MSAPFILVTGAGGMVGQHVAEAAAQRGCRLRLADSHWGDAPGAGPRPADEGRTGSPDVIAAERVAFDVRDPESCRAATAGVTAVIHCAGVVGPARARVDPLVTLAVNVTGTANLLEAAFRHGARLIAVSTATLYGHRPDLAPLPETAPADPLTVYDGSKLMAEIHCTTHRKTFGSDVASVRTGFVYGAGTRIGEYFIPRVLAGEAIAEPVGREHPCDFTYVLDLAEALVAAALAPTLRHSVYNVTGGVLRTRGELAASVRRLLPQARITQGAGIDPARHLRGASVLTRAAADFGWSPRHDLDAGLADWLARLRPDG